MIKQWILGILLFLGLVFTVLIYQPQELAVFAQTDILIEIRSYSQTLYPNQTSYQRIISLDGRELWQRKGIWNSAGGIFDWGMWVKRNLASQPIAGQTQLGAYDQVVIPNNISKQRVLSLDGRTLWERSGAWNAGISEFDWGDWQEYLITDFNIDEQTGLDTIRLHSQAVYPNQTSKQRILSIDGRQLWERSGPWNESAGIFDWGSWVKRDLASQPIAGQTQLGNFSQVVLPNNISKQRVLSLDGRMLWERSGAWNAGISEFDWGDWQEYLITDFNITDINGKFSILTAKIVSIIDKHEQVYPLYSQTGYDVDGDGLEDTLSSLDSKYASFSNEDRAEWRARLFCSPPPALTPGSQTENAWLESWASWRKCMTASHTVLARYHLFQYLNHGANQLDKEKMEQHIYMGVIHVDALIAGPEYGKPLSGLTNSEYEGTSIYTLRDTFRTARYLADGAGAFKIWGVTHHLGLLPQFYCTALEVPYDPAQNCRTINLQERIRQISSSVATKAASEWMIHDDGSLRTEYWDSSRYWINNLPQSYSASPNRTFNPSAGIGWYDLAGRRSMGGENGLPDQSMSPHFFGWQMGGMTLAAKLALSGGQEYQDFVDFGLWANGYVFAFNRDNPSGNYMSVNRYGDPVRGNVNSLCDGTENLLADDPMAICEGGTKEWHWYGNDDIQSVQTGLVYMSQHLGGMTAVLNWEKPPDSYIQNGLNHYYVFKGSYFKDGDSYINFANGGFNKSTILKYFPTFLGACGQEGYKYYETSTGLVVNERGETAAELVATALSSLANIVFYKDIDKAGELLETADQMLDSLVTTPLSPTLLADCAGPWTHSTNVSVYMRKATQINNFLSAYLMFKKYPQPALPAGVPIPETSDYNQDGVVNNLDVFEFVARPGDFPPAVWFRAMLDWGKNI
ncbi:hypothetical protein KKD62_01605 [Patescibacteria group bacterium]|nr:hypothetical protein [Patescibacteria group bacterium]MBU1931417.1 hypothetical protein [Patescibacteria group bacterium]